MITTRLVFIARYVDYSRPHVTLFAVCSFSTLIPLRLHVSRHIAQFFRRPTCSFFAVSVKITSFCFISTAPFRINHRFPTHAHEIVSRGIVPCDTPDPPLRYPPDHPWVVVSAKNSAPLSATVSK
eukprot:185252-Prorocentrum_minimum.AAC.1